ncbi:MAG: HD family phosphohydrolase, partial [Desulfuromonadales bacterium]
MSSERLTAVRNALRHLMTGVANASLYAVDHPQVERFCVAARTELARAMADGRELSLLLIDDDLICDGSPLSDTLYAGRFCLALKARGIGHLRFLPGISPGELRSLVGALTKAGQVSGELCSTDNLRFGKVEVRYAGG